MKTRREFLKYGGIGLASVASMFIPASLVNKFTLVKEGEIRTEDTDVYNEKLYKLEIAVVQKKGHLPMISGKATPYNKKRTERYFSIGVNLEKYKKDKDYTKELLRRINHNLRVAYKYA